MPDLVPALRRHFGHDAFRPGQEKLIRAILAGRDALGILPTGGGKSVLYLLPSAMRPGLTLVVSPLVSLMADQVDRANRAGIPAGALHQGVDAAAREALLARATAGELRVLLVAPERLEIAAFRASLSRMPLRLLAVDEAHCVVHWGWDFRPSYLRLSGLGARLGVPVVAVTATATPPVQAELVTMLGLRDPVRHVSSFDRPNLAWGVVRVPDDAERWRRLERLVRTSPGPALVYTGTRRQTEAVRAGLARRGVDAESYHAGLETAERERVQTRFLSGQCPLVVATNAFGMGVDKPDVRRVIHWSAPGSLEAYYQEAGRAGRDGGPALCLVLRGRGDERLHRRFLDSAHPPPRRLQRLARRLPALDPSGSEEQRAEVVARALGRRAALDAGGLLRALERYGLVQAAAGSDARRAGERAPDERTPGEPAPDGCAEGAVRPGSREGRAFTGDGPADAEPWTRTARRRRRSARERLSAMRAYLDARACRRATFLRYFGEEPAPGPCAGCDRCGGVDMSR